MANSYFQFKQFRIDQGLCGMKVTTDACLFGAIAAASVTKGTPASKVLDIGTGTGLLSLMLAQTSPDSEIHALEIDQDAFAQANLNFQNSPWSERLTIEHSSFQDFNTDTKFDLIISNPPFFSKNQLGESAKKNLAVHNDSLSIDQLATGVTNHLSEKGELFLLYPPFEMGLFIEAAAALNLFPNQIFEIKDNTSKKVIRQMALFSNIKIEIKTIELVIKQNDGNYTQAFIDLLKPYYLHL